MLKEVLRLLEKRGVLAQMGPEAAQKLVLDVVKRSREEYDCNSGEITLVTGSALIDQES